MDIKTKALCIKTIDYKDGDKLLTLASIDEGKITASIKSAVSPRSKLKLCASPLCFGEYILSKNKRTGKLFVIGCSIEDNFFECWEDIHRYSASQIVLEVLDKSTYDSVDCRQELMLALQALSGINYADTYPYIIVVWFLVGMLEFIGVDISQNEELPSDVLQLLQALSKLEVIDLDSLELSGSQLLTAFQYLNLIIKNVLSSKINAINQALKLISAN